VEQIAYANNGAQRMVTTKQHDFLNRITSISSVPSGSSVVRFSYDYNSANQRTLRREADGSYWRYAFDALGQVKSGKKYWSDGTPVAGQQFEYAFDTIGNRTGTKAGGDENGGSLRSATYAPDLLNRYSSRSVPGAVDVMGIASKGSDPFSEAAAILNRLPQVFGSPPPAISPLPRLSQP